MAAEPIPWITIEPSAATGVRLSGDRRTLLLDTLVPSGAPACMCKLKAVLTDPMTDLMWVQISFTSPSGDRASERTKESTATVKVTLGDRDVLVDHYTRFTAEGAKPPEPRMCGTLG